MLLFSIAVVAWLDKRRLLRAIGEVLRRPWSLARSKLWRPGLPDGADRKAAPPEAPSRLDGWLH